MAYASLKLVMVVIDDFTKKLHEIDCSSHKEAQDFIDMYFLLDELEKEFPSSLKLVPRIEVEHYVTRTTLNGIVIKDKTKKGNAHVSSSAKTTHKKRNERSMQGPIPPNKD